VTIPSRARALVRSSTRFAPCVAVVLLLLTSCGSSAAPAAPAPSSTTPDVSASRAADASATLAGPVPSAVATAAAPLLPTAVPTQPAPITSPSTAPTKTGPARIYPDLALTPGASDPNVTQANIKQTICVAGYTRTVRPPESYTEPLKLQQIASLRLPGRASDYEEDHVIPLEVGGHPRDPRNLWPEAYAPSPGAREKDRVETFLHMCGRPLDSTKGLCLIRARPRARQPLNRATDRSC
jgi:hypothetical protein